MGYGAASGVGNGFVGGIGSRRNGLMGIGEVIGVGLRVLEYKDVGIEVMDMGEYEG